VQQVDNRFETFYIANRITQTEEPLHEALIPANRNCCTRRRHNLFCPRLALLTEGSTDSRTGMTNYVYTTQNGFTSYHFDSRFDYRLFSNNNLFVTFSKYHGTNDNHGGVFPQIISNVDDRSYLITVNDAHIFTPRLTNEFIFAIGNGALVTVDPNQVSYLNGASNPFNSLFQNTGGGLTKGVLAIDVLGYASPGFNEVFRAENQTLQVSDNVNWIHGRHSLSFGMNYAL
jgi:hypothetical protein